MKVLNMHSLFISYSSVDVEFVKDLATALEKNGTSIWRDQEKIHGGDKWPKVLGEAIAANDLLLLVWSEQAAVSEYVELEWCTAIALKKKILPCGRDNTPLPDSLKAIHVIDGRDLDSAVEAILHSLRSEAVARDLPRAAEVIKKLGQIQARDSREVLQAAKSIFDQRQWTVEGNVYQAARDIYITTGSSASGKSDKTLAERWQTWVALAVGVLTVVTLMFQVGDRISPVVQPSPATNPSQRTTVPSVDGPVAQPQKEEINDQPLEGSIRTVDGNPLSGVRVSLPKLGLNTVTDQDGEFRFTVKGQKEAEVALLAQRAGYQTYETDVLLGSTTVSFNMERARRK